MDERITGKELRQLASLAHKARRSYTGTEPALAGRFETAAAAAAHLAERQERAERLAEIQHQLEQVKIELGVEPDPCGWSLSERRSHVETVSKHSSSDG